MTAAQTKNMPRPETQRRIERREKTQNRKVPPNLWIRLVRHVGLKSRCCSCAGEPDFGLNRLVGESLNKCTGLPALSIR